MNPAPCMGEGTATLGSLLEGIADCGARSSMPVSGLAIDSRRIHDGDLFIACPGSRGHALDHIDEAVHRGASAILYERPDPAHEMRLDELTAFMPVVRVDRLRGRVGVIAARFYGHPSRRLTVFGVTGTNGKTSCSHFLAQAMTDLGRPCAVLGTLGLAEPGQRPGAVDPAQRTTPDPVSLQAILARLSCPAIAMEVSSHGLDQGRVNGVEFTTAIFTNLSRDHLDYHGDLENYGRCKACLFTMPGLEQAVLNGDDASAPAFHTRIARGVRRLVYGLEDWPGTAFPGASRLHGEVHEADVDGMRLRVDGDAGRAEFHLPLLGRFNASNALAVLGALLMQSIPLDAACAALEGLRPVPGRMECIALPSGGHAVIDYAHTPDALQKVIETLRAHYPGRLSCVFGCGGERDSGKRPLMGRVAERLADRVVLTDDNPRHEAPKVIVADILAGMTEPARAEVIHDRGRAIEAALAEAGRGDVVLIAGKGHEAWQSVGGQSLPWDDRAFVRRWASEGRA